MTQAMSTHLGEALGPDFFSVREQFTDEQWRARTTARRVFYAIREGVPRTPMASWKVFSDDETWDLVAYVLSIAGGGSGPHPEEGHGRPR